MAPPVVLDTNVLFAGLRSRRGASFRLLELVDSGLFEPCVSVPLVFEYEAVLKRSARELGLTHQDVDDVIDFVCRVARPQPIFFLWRPLLRDPKDDMVLEVAVEGHCEYIVTHNVRDFAGAERFGIQTILPGAFLKQVGG
jgi:putative PIN family toxin of toxin-antitoxin system